MEEVTRTLNGRTFVDDGSLACLNLGTDKERKFFSCPAKKQMDLVGRTFWVLEYFGGLQSKDGKEKYIFKAKFNLEDAEEFKVWTGSSEVFMVLDKLGELNLFPRRVTLRQRSRGGFYFE